MVRVGIIGAGLIAHYHAFMLSECAEPHTVVGVYDLDAGRCERFASDWGVGHFASLDALLDVVEAVFICTWTSAHLGAVVAAADRGLAVFCEKPLGPDLQTARAVVAAVEAAGVVDRVGLVLRSAPAMLVLREWVRDTEGAGRVMNVVFRDDQYLPTQGVYASTWRGDADLAGSGAVLEHSIHDLDLLEWLFGSVQQVSAHTATFHGLEGIEDSASVLVRFHSGATATLTSVWHDILARPSLRRMEVFCERALFTLDGDGGPLRRQSDDDEAVLAGDELVEWLAIRGIDAESSENAFLRAVREGKASSPTCSDALRAHVLVDAVYRSAAAGGVVVEVGGPGE